MKLFQKIKEWLAWEGTSVKGEVIIKEFDNYYLTGWGHQEFNPLTNKCRWFIYKDSIKAVSKLRGDLISPGEDKLVYD